MTEPTQPEPEQPRSVPIQPPAEPGPTGSVGREGVPGPAVEDDDAISRVEFYRNMNRLEEAIAAGELGTRRIIAHEANGIVQKLGWALFGIGSYAALFGLIFATEKPKGAK
jgi:hypothetical protein